jgi:hypothetical protein
MVGQVEERRPPFGTACLDCKFKGHFCNATGYKNRVPLCAYCMDGVPCRVTRSDLARAGGGAYRSIAGLPKPEPQPALARGARPSPGMPARRVFEEAEPVHGERKRGPYKANGPRRARAQEMLLGGMSVTAIMAATGLSKTQVYRIRGQMGIAPAAKVENVTVTTKVVESGAAVASVDEGETVGEMSKESSPRSATASAEVSAGTAAAAVAEADEGELVREQADKWEVVDVAEVPKAARQSIYDDIVAALPALPVGKALCRTFGNREIAGTYAKGISKRAQKLKLPAQVRQDGATVYVWRKD